MNCLVKRVVDILIALPAVIVLIPLWILIAVLIKCESRGSIFYLHKRIGKNAKPFNCFKFRSMKIDSDPNKLVSEVNDDRVTKIGKFLRISSLDETPQLINVLFGDMSIVGPRPALPSQAEKFSTFEKDKLLVKPGLTGWTQINGRNSISYEKRMELDCWYAKNWTVWLDLQIICKTPFILFDSKGIYDVK